MNTLLYILIALDKCATLLMSPLYKWLWDQKAFFHLYYFSSVVTSLILFCCWYESLFSISLNLCEAVFTSVFQDDFILMCKNAMLYNAPDTIYYKSAEKLLNLGTKALSEVSSFWQLLFSKIYSYFSYSMFLTYSLALNSRGA